MKAMLAALPALALAACATPTKPADSRPAAAPTVLLTRAEVASYSTAELARRLLPPEIAATVVSHYVLPPYSPGEALRWIRFELAPRPLAADICGRVGHIVSFLPSREGDPMARRPDAPSYAAWTLDDTMIALAPDCRTGEGQHFASIRSTLPIEMAIEALRSAETSRAAAAAPGPLPFRLTCWGGYDDKCGSDPRATLAALPLAQAFAIERSRHLPGAFIIQIGNPEGVERDDPFWEIRFKQMGTKQAEVVMSWGPRTLE
jgi:hypothetical protein